MGFTIYLKTKNKFDWNKDVFSFSYSTIEDALTQNLDRSQYIWRLLRKQPTLDINEILHSSDPTTCTLSQSQRLMIPIVKEDSIFHPVITRLTHLIQLYDSVEIEIR